MSAPARDTLPGRTSRVHSVHRGRCVKRTLRPGILFFPCSSVDSVDSVAIIIADGIRSYPTRRCRVHSVHRGRCVKRTLRPGILFFPCSSVDSVAIIIADGIRSYPTRRCRVHSVHRGRCVKRTLRPGILFFPCLVIRGFRGPWLLSSRMGSAPTPLDGVGCTPCTVAGASSHPTPGYIVLSVFFRGFRGHYHRGWDPLLPH